MLLLLLLACTASPPTDADFVPVPGGGVTLGTSSPGTRGAANELTFDVDLPPFEVMRAEVTRRQYRALVGPDASHFTGSLELPVQSVTWRQAHDFCAALDARMDGDPVRLPTEAEWEHAARAGSPGDRPRDLQGYAVHGRGEDDGPLPLGGRVDNGWGLYDLHGNVWEWTTSVYREDPRATRGHARSDLSPDLPGDRVIRGGSYGGPPSDQRSAVRVGLDPSQGMGGVGFRCVRAPEPPQLPSSP